MSAAIDARIDAAAALPDAPAAAQALLDSAEERTQLGHGPLAAPKRAQNQQPLGMRQTAHQPGGRIAGRDHLIYIHDLEFILLEC